VSNDDPEQARQAAAAIDACEACFVPLTVALELEWVLRGAYCLSSGSCAVLLSFNRGLILQAERLQLHPPLQTP
jgi:hypothetical protein